MVKIGKGPKEKEGIAKGDQRSPWVVGPRTYVSKGPIILRK